MPLMSLKYIIVLHDCLIDLIVLAFNKLERTSDSLDFQYTFLL